MQFFFRIYVNSIKPTIPKPKQPVSEQVKVKIEMIENEQYSVAEALSDEKNKENVVENKIIIKTEEDSKVMKPLNAPVVKVERESPVKSGGKENKAEVSNETNKIEALQKLTDNISTLVREDTKVLPLPQTFKTPSSSSLKDIGMLTTIPIAPKPAPAPISSPTRPVSNCVRILPKPSPNTSSSFSIPRSQVLTTMTRPTHLTIRSNLPMRPTFTSTQAASHLILSTPSMTRPVPTPTPVLFTTVSVPSTSTTPGQSQVATAVSAYNNAIKQNNILIRSNMLMAKAKQVQPNHKVNHANFSTEVKKTGEKVTKAIDKIHGNNRPLSRSEKVLKSAKYLNKVGGISTPGDNSETETKEPRKINGMKEFLENPRILEDLETHAAETLLQVSRNCAPPREISSTAEQTFKKPLPVLSPKSPIKSMPLISDCVSDVPIKITNVPPKIMSNGITKSTQNTLNRKIQDLKKTFTSEQSKKSNFDPYDFDSSSQNIPAPKKPSSMKTVYSSSKPNNKLHVESPCDRNRKSGSPKLTLTNTCNENNTNGKKDSLKPNDPFNMILKGNGLTSSFLSNKQDKQKQDLKRNFSETEMRCIETEDGMLSVSLMTHDSHQEIENKKRKVEEPDVSIQLMSLPEESNITQKDSKDLLKRKQESSDQNTCNNKKVCFKPNGKSVEHISEMLKDKKFGSDKVHENTGTIPKTESEKKTENMMNGVPRTNKTLPKLIEINAAPFPKTPVTKTLNIKTQQSSLENSPKHELLTALDLSPSSKSPPGDTKPNSAPNSPNIPSGARSSPVPRSSPTPRLSPSLLQSISPKSDLKPSPPKKSSPIGTEFRSIPDLVRPEYFKMLHNRSLITNNNHTNHLQDWYKAMSVGSIPPHPLMFNAVPTPSPESLSKT